jgi:hypothetical protein
MLLAMLANAVKPDLLMQLAKMPSLIAHYQHHINDENEQISFFDFLVLHYGQNSSHKQAENHDDLPLFNNSGACLAFISTVSLSHEFRLIQNGTIQLNSPYSENYSFVKLTSIFQPPQYT